MIRLYLPVHGVGSHVFRDGKHGRVPRFPLLFESCKDLGILLRQVGAFALVCGQIEQEFVATNLEVLPIARTYCALRVGLIAPEQGSRVRRLVAEDDRHQFAHLALAGTLLTLEMSLSCS